MTLSSSRLPSGCLDAAATILGDKWTPQLIRAMAIQESSRFCQLQDAVGGINPRTLSARLTSLEAAAIITKHRFAEVPPRTEYSLTQKGRDLVPILSSMASWSHKYAPTAS